MPVYRHGGDRDPPVHRHSGDRDPPVHRHSGDSNSAELDIFNRLNLVLDTLRETKWQNLIIIVYNKRLYKHIMSVDVCDSFSQEGNTSIPTSAELQD